MSAVSLKNSSAAYRRRFNRFLWLLLSVKALTPRDRHLWKVMDGVAFQDTETALETALFNEGETLDSEMAERLTVKVMKDRRARSAHARKAND